VPPFNDILLFLSSSEFIDLLGKRNKMPSNVISSILHDICLNTSGKRPDILIQPLIRESSSLLFIAPSLIYTHNWEVCLLRNWAKFNHDVYSRTVAQKKTKLSDLFASQFDMRRFMVSTRKKLYDRQHKEIGDVDVTIFDPEDGLLALFEVKWIIEPDSVQETIEADRKIFEGTNQVLACKSQFESDPQDFLKQVFPNRLIEASKINKIQIGVIVYGDVGGNDTIKSGVPIFDYYLTCEAIKEKAGQSLRIILDHARLKHDTICTDITRKSLVMRIKLGGILFVLPGYGKKLKRNNTSEKSTPNLGRTSPCICGSGKKYKDCCKNLETYEDDVLVG
jgi:hypothetical protein